jgi:hypothetical protein
MQQGNEESKLESLHEIPRCRWDVNIKVVLKEVVKCVQNLVRKPEGKRPLRIPRHRWKIILEWILGKHGEKFSIGYTWLRIGTNCRLL